MQYYGHVHPEFLSVADCLVGQIAPDKRSGAALTVYHRGIKVVDIWAGQRNHEGSPWEEETLACSFSTTKGVVSALVHILVEQGRLDYDAPIARYWPEFAAQGKKQITLKHVLTHRTGLHRIRPLIEDPMLMTNWQAMVRCIEKAEPVALPGGQSAYQALTYGWIVGEVLQRVSGLPFAELLKCEITDPLGLKGMFVGLPEERMEQRALLAGYPAECGSGEHPESGTKRKPSLAKQAMTAGMKGGFRLAGARWDEAMAALAPKGIRRFSFNDPRVVASSIPAANGMFTARDLARLYSVIAEGGELDGIRLLSRDAVRRMGAVQVDQPDRVLPVNMKWRLGYHRVFCLGGRLPGAFGHFGWGGSGAWADPVNRLSVGFTVNNQRGTSPVGDLRIMQLNGMIAQSAHRHRVNSSQSV